PTPPNASTPTTRADRRPDRRGFGTLRLIEVSVVWTRGPDFAGLGWAGRFTGAADRAGAGDDAGDGAGAPNGPCSVPGGDGGRVTCNTWRTVVTRSARCRSRSGESASIQCRVRR